MPFQACLGIFVTTFAFICVSFVSALTVCNVSMFFFHFRTILALSFIRRMYIASYFGHSDFRVNYYKALVGF